MSDYQANGFTSSLLEQWEDRSTITLVGNLSEDGFASNLVVTRQRLKAGTSAADFAQSQLKQLASQVQRPNVESQRTFKNNHGHDVFQQIHEFSVETRSVKQVQAFLSNTSLNHATVFVITGTAALSTFAQSLPQFRHFIEHFHATDDER